MQLKDKTLSVKEGGHWDIFSNLPLTINYLWPLCSLDCCVPSQDSSCYKCPVMQCTEEHSLAFSQAARMTSTGKLLDPHCVNYNKHSRSQPLGPAPKPITHSPERHTWQFKPREALLQKDLALKEFNWPWIMKYLLSSFQVKYSGNLWVASDLCDYRVKENWNNQTKH